MGKLPQIKVVENDSHRLANYAKGAPKEDVTKKGVIDNPINTTGEVHERGLSHHSLSRTLIILQEPYYHTEKSMVAEVAKRHGEAYFMHHCRKREDGKCSNRFRYSNSKQRVVQMTKAPTYERDLL